MRNLLQWVRGAGRRRGTEEERPRSVHLTGLALHRADGPIVRSALALWADGPDGLGWRFKDGEAPGTPLVQLIFSPSDWRAVQEAGAAAWERSTTDTLGRLVARIRVPWPGDLQGPAFELIPDESPRIGRYRLGLAPGQFASVILPHRWPDPDRWRDGLERPRRRVVVSTARSGAEPIAISHLWKGQETWTLGSDWLDSARLPPGGEAALVSLEQAEDGALTVRADAGLSASLSQEGEQDIVVVRAGDAVVMQVLVEAPQTGLSARTIEGQGAAVPRPAVRAHATLAEMVESNTSASMVDEPASQTLFARAPEPTGVDLDWTGLLLPAIEFPELFDGYERGLDTDGRVVPAHSKEAALVVRVLADRIELEARQKGVLLADEPVPPGRRHTLSEGARITLPSRRVVQLDAPPRAARQRYRGVLRGLSQRRPLAWGRRYTMGRGPTSDLPLMDDADTAGLIWKPALRNVGSVRVSGGMVPRNRFRLDAVMVSSDHAALDLSRSPLLISRSTRAAVWIVRDGVAHKVARGSGSKAPVQPGDELWIGHQCFLLDSAGADLNNPLTIDVSTLVECGQEAARAVVEARSAPPPAPERPSSPVADQDTLDPTDVPVGRPPTFIPLDDGPAAAAVADSLFQPASGSDSSETFDFVPAASLPPPRPRPVMAAPEGRADAAEPAGTPDPDAATPVEVPAGGADRTIDAGSVAVCADESTWDWELSRPYLLRLEGWLVTSGDTIGTGATADVVVPVLAAPREGVPATELARLRISRGAAGFELSDPESGAAVMHGPSAVVIRRLDEDGELDHEVRLELQRPDWLRNPRQRMLALTGDDPVARALFDRGVEVAGPRTLRTGDDAVQVLGLPAGEGLQARRLRGRSVHVARDGGRLRALAEGDETIPPGGRLRVGAAVYVLEAE